MDLAGLNRISMDGSASLRVEDDQGTRPNSPASVEGGQASHAPPMNEPGQGAEGTMGILQQLAQALQRAGDRPKMWCEKCTPMCASARVAPSNIVYLWYGYRSTGIDVLTTENWFSNVIWIYVMYKKDTSV